MAAAIELSRMTSSMMGDRYRMKKVYVLWLLNRDDERISSTTLPTPAFFMINRQVLRAAMGIKMELVRKSKKSRMDMPNGCTALQTLYPKAQAVPRRSMITPISIQPLALDHPNWSIKVDTPLSIKEMELVSAANNTIRKNRIPGI